MRYGAWAAAALLTTGCQLLSLPLPTLPGTAAKLSDTALQPLASGVVMAAGSMGKAIAGGAQAAGAKGMIPFGVLQVLPIPVAIPSASSWSVFWDYRDGWYWSKFNLGSRELRFRFETANGEPAGFNVMDPAEYGMPPKHTGFPQDLVKFHTEYGQTYAMGVSVASTLYGDIPPAPPTAATRIPQSGSGSVKGVPVIGDLTFTVTADANGAGNDVKGTITHQATLNGHTYQAVTQMNLNGIQPPCSITRDGSEVATIEQGNSSGTWQLHAEGQVVPIDAMAMGLGG